MNFIKDLINTEQVTATSKWERLGDLLLTPKSWLYGRQRICVVGKKKEDVYDVRYEEISDSKWYKAAGVIGLVLLAPIGLLFKGIALVFSDKTRTAFLNHDLTVHRTIERNKVIQDYEREKAVFRKYAYSLEKNAAGVRRLDSDFYLMKKFVTSKEEQVHKYKFNEIFQKGTQDTEQILPFLLSVSRAPIAYSKVLSGEVQIFNFQECACSDDKFNRLMNDRRAKIESQILSDITSRFPNRNTQINIMSLGSGYLANEFVLLGLLVKAGYNNIRLVLVDTVYTYHDESTKSMLPYNQETLEKMANDKEMQHPLINFYRLKDVLDKIKVHLQIEVYKDIDDYSTVHKEPEDLDAIIGIDINFEDKRRLKEQPPKEVEPEEEIKHSEELNAPTQHLHSHDALGVDIGPTPVVERYREVSRQTVKEDLAILQKEALKKDGKMHLAYGNLNFNLSKNDLLDVALRKNLFEASLRENKVGFIAKLKLRYMFKKGDFDSDF